MTMTDADVTFEPVRKRNLSGLRGRLPTLDPSSPALTWSGWASPRSG